MITAKVNIREIANQTTMRMDAKYWIKEKSKRKIKVRFNLGRGKNYMKWKIESKSSGVEYHSPENIQFVMKNCILKNNRKVADKILNGENKSVCAWIMCESISIYSVPLEIEQQEHLFDKPIGLKYNPRKNPFWTNAKNENLDNTEYEKIYSIKSELFI